MGGNPSLAKTNKSDRPVEFTVFMKCNCDIKTIVKIFNLEVDFIAIIYINFNIEFVCTERVEHRVVLIKSVKKRVIYKNKKNGS